MKKKLVRILMLAAALAVLTVCAFAAETSERTKLDDPTGVQWCEPGLIEFRAGSSTQNEYAIHIYKEGVKDPVSGVTWEVDPDHSVGEDGALRSDLFWEGYWKHEKDDTADCNMDSGTYYFTVQSLGDGKRYSNSEIVKSDNWTYTKPDDLLPAPTDLRWENGYAKWKTVAEDVSGYMIAFYWIDPNTHEKDFVGGISAGSYEETDPEERLEDWMLEEHGKGDYCFAVRTMSQNINDICNSKWSDYSEIYHVDEVYSGVASDLDGLLDSYTGTLTENDKAELKTAIAGMDKDDELWTAMAADKGEEDGVIEKLTALEALVGGPATVEVSKEGMDAEKISIVGANLNQWEGTPTLNISEPKEDVVIPELYNSTVAVKFSMKLDDGTESEEGAQPLDVPVRITMPIPENINPDFLTILHYHQDGTCEEIVFPHTFQKGEQWYVSFVVTSFSDFAMIETVFTTDEDTGELVVSAAEGSKTVMIATYSSNGQMLDCISGTVTDGTARLSLEELHGEPASLKIFWLDENNQPVRAAYEYQDPEGQ